MENEYNESVFFVPEATIREKIARRFDHVKRQLLGLLPLADIQHVGSTAIPGSFTKGDLDIQVRVDVSQYSAAKGLLSEVFHVNDGGFVAEDAVSFEDYSGEPLLGVHLTVIGGSCDIQWKFRDALIASPILRAEYDLLKTRFEGRSMSRYRDAKALFIEKVMQSDLYKTRFE